MGNNDRSSILYTYMDCKISNLSISVNLIKNMCVKRLKLYNFLSSSYHSDTIEEMEKNLGCESPFLNMFLNDDDAKHIRDDSIYIDKVSHFVLRICYAGKYAGIFVDFEEKWLQIRFKYASIEEKENFLKTNCQYPKNDDGLYVMPYQKALHLVSNRECYVTSGVAYVAENGLLHVACQDFRTRLLNQLDQETMPNIEKLPPKLKAMVNSLKLVVPHTSKVEQKLNFKKLDEASQFFPLCMKLQFENLRKNHYVSYFSRFELGTFLKDIGLSLDDTLTLFEEEFKIKNLWCRKFNYYFTHLYGKVGFNKSGYNSESCQSLIKKSTNSNGCPFSNLQLKTQILKESLTKDGFDEIQIANILKSVKNKNFQKACGEYCGSGEPTSDPVNYFKNHHTTTICDIEDFYCNDR